MTYHYQPDVLKQLERHGVRPGPGTAPDLVREFLNDLYRFELRRLRGRQVSGEIARIDYVDHVVALRKRYVLLSLPVQWWAKRVS